MAFIEKHRIQSAGSAYTDEVGFYPDTIEVWNATKWATDATKVKFYWHRGMAAGYSLSELTEDSSANRAIDSSNGFTVLTTSSWTDNQTAITGATQANPCVLTVTSHPWTAANNGEAIRVRDVVGMTELNGNFYKMTYVDANSISLDVDASGFTSYTSGGIAYNISQKVYNSGSYRVTLGSVVAGSSSDVLYVEYRQADQYTDRGDVA